MQLMQHQVNQTQKNLTCRLKAMGQEPTVKLSESTLFFAFQVLSLPVLGNSCFEELVRNEF